ncbi:hypothetical protein OHU45_25570 [Streptomyces tubercidicus]|uniref:hypothetical protein n=1 Tax=Streptomyces tubercidicus TaxID=47759 RepID=UPI0030E56E94
MAGLIFGVCAVLIAVSSAIYLACTSQPAREEAFYTARRARIWAFAGCFLGSFLTVPSVAVTVDLFLGRNGISTLGGNLFAILATLSLAIVSVNWTHPSAHIRRAVVGRIFAVSCVMAVLTWEFHLTNVTSAELASTSPSSAEVASYMLTHLGYLAVAATAITLRYTALARAAWQRRRIAAAGLAVTAAGTLSGLVYAVSRSVAAVAHLHGRHWPSVMESYVVPTAGALATLFITVGLSLPIIGHRVILPLRRRLSARVAKKAAPS